MTRTVLSVSISAGVLLLGLFTSWVQSVNFARAADLDRLQRESEWCVRRVSGLRAQAEQLEFALRVQQNRALERGMRFAMEGRD